MKLSFALDSNPLQYFCLENSMERGVWWATVHGVAKATENNKQQGDLPYPKTWRGENSLTFITYYSLWRSVIPF